MANYVSLVTGEKWDLWGKYRDETQYSELFPGRDKISRIDPSRIDPRQKNNAYHHLILSDIRLALGSEIFSTYHKFCVIRNPWDRLVSMYEYGLPRGLMSTAGLTFQQWFYSRPVTPVLLPWIEVDDVVPKDLHFIDFNNFNAEVVNFLQSVEIPCNSYPMSHEKKSIRRDYTEYYDSKMIDIIADECKDDIEYFGFVYGETAAIFR